VRLVVADANVFVRALTGSVDERQAEACRTELRDADALLIPTHTPLEVMHVLNREALRRAITQRVAEAAYGKFRQLDIRTYEPPAAMVWAWRHNVNPYDGAYLAVALDHEARIVTGDARLARACKMLAIPDLDLHLIS